MQTISQRATVGTSATWLARFKVSDLQSLSISAIGVMEVGFGGVSVGSGIPLAAGQVFAFNHLDFRKDDKEVQESYVDLYGVATVATTCHIFGWCK